MPDKSCLFAGMPHPPKDFPANPSNPTPDRDTGIGTCSDADFLQTLRRGVDPSGRQLHPFMPWRQDGRMSDDDLRAAYAFLRIVPPVR